MESSTACEYVCLLLLEGSPGAGRELSIIELAHTSLCRVPVMERLKRIAHEVVEEAHRRGKRTGLGLYPWGVHIDTGALPPKGKRRRWYGT